jgi:hypothetical protein
MNFAFCRGDKPFVGFDVCCCIHVGIDD